MPIAPYDVATKTECHPRSPESGDEKSQPSRAELAAAWAARLARTAAIDVLELEISGIQLAQPLQDDRYEFARCLNINPGAEGPVDDVCMFAYACVIDKPDRFD